MNQKALIALVATGMVAVVFLAMNTVVGSIEPYSPSASLCGIDGCTCPCATKPADCGCVAK